MQNKAPAFGLRFLLAQSQHPHLSLPSTHTMGLYEGGEKLGPFICVGEKDFGINPGFFALSLNDAYHQQARNFLVSKIQANDAFFVEQIAPHFEKIDALNQLLSPQFIESPVYQMLLEQPAHQEVILQYILSEYNKQRLTLRTQIAKILVETDPDFEIALEERFFSKSHTLDSLSHPLAHTTPAYQVLLEDRICRQKIIHKFSVETAEQPNIEKYVFKFDHHPPIFGKILALPLANILLLPKFKTFYEKIGKQFGQSIAQRLTYYRAIGFKITHLSTIKRQNLRAIMTCLATDLARARGLYVSHTSLAKTTYPNGAEKLLVFSGWNDDLETLDTSELILKAKIDPKGLLIPQQFFCEGSLEGLGATLLPFLTLMVLFGRKTTFDLVGNHLFGLNIGGKPFKIKSVLKTLTDNFDCLSLQNKLNLYSDTPLAEKMKGLYALYKLRTGNMPNDAILDKLSDTEKTRLKYINQDQDLKIIDDYIEYFPQHQIYFEKIKQQLITLDNGILKVFESRLSLSPTELTLLENFEKLSSPVTAKDKTKHIIYNHLHLNPRTRIVWQMSEVNENLVFKCANALSHQVKTFLNQTQFIDLNIEIKNDSIILPKNQLDNFISHFNEANIAKFKGNALAAMIEAERMVIQEEDYDRLANQDKQPN